MLEITTSSLEQWPSRKEKAGLYSYGVSLPNSSRGTHVASQAEALKHAICNAGVEIIQYEPVVVQPNTQR